MAQLTVWTRPQGNLLRIDRDLETEAAAGSECRVRQLETAVDRVARFGLWRPRCLVRAMALHRLLERTGVRGSRVRIGVQLQGQRFSAHAWVVWGSLVLGDDPGRVRRFATITEGTAPDGV